MYAWTCETYCCYMQFCPHNCCWQCYEAAAKSKIWRRPCKMRYHLPSSLGAESDSIASHFNNNKKRRRGQDEIFLKKILLSFNRFYLEAKDLSLQCSQDFPKQCMNFLRPLKLQALFNNSFLKSLNLSIWAPMAFPSTSLIMQCNTFSS